MSDRLRQDSETAIRTQRQRRAERNREEDREWDRDHFAHDLRRASRRITTEISGNPTEARELREARQQVREGRVTTQEELDRSDDEG